MSAETLEILERGLASMKSAGLNTQRVYDACAVFVKELGERCLSIESELTAAQARIKEMEGILRMYLATADKPLGMSEIADIDNLARKTLEKS